MGPHIDDAALCKIFPGLPVNARKQLDIFVKETFPGLELEVLHKTLFVRAVQYNGLDTIGCTGFNDIPFDGDRAGMVLRNYRILHLLFQVVEYPQVIKCNPRPGNDLPWNCHTYR